MTHPRRASFHLNVAIFVSAVAACAPPDDPTNRSSQSLSVAPAGEPTAAEEQRMQEYLANRYSPNDIFHRFTTRGGDDIDCIPRERQPAARLLVQQGLPIPPPPAQPAATGPDLFFDDETDAAGRTRRCPPGTVALVQITLEQIKRFGKLENFLSRGRSRRGDAPGAVSPSTLPVGTRQYAYGDQVVANQGGGVVINFWDPAVADPGEHSISQVWVRRGSGERLQTVEAGWIKNTLLSPLPKIFIFHTPDNYTTKCYDLQCGKFMMENGACLGCTPPLSTPGGTQAEAIFFWQRDTSTQEWGFYFNSTLWGKYRADTFEARGLRLRGAVVQFGGEVLDNYSPVYTPTDMGSGHFPPAGYGFAAYQRNAVYLTNSGSVATNATLNYARSNANCWDIAPTSQPGWATAFFVGGGGYNGPGGTCFLD
jgi:hypothetical protein